MRAYEQVARSYLQVMELVVHTKENSSQEESVMLSIRRVSYRDANRWG